MNKSFLAILLALFSYLQFSVAAVTQDSHLTANPLPISGNIANCSGGNGTPPKEERLAFSEERWTCGGENKCCNESNVCLMDLCCHQSNVGSRCCIR